MLFCILFNGETEPIYQADSVGHPRYAFRQASNIGNPCRQNEMS